MEISDQYLFFKEELMKIKGIIIASVFCSSMYASATGQLPQFSPQNGGQRAVPMLIQPRVNDNNNNNRPQEDAPNINKAPNNNKGGNHLLGAAVIGATVWLAYTALNSEPVQNILQDLGIVSKKRTPRLRRRARPRRSEFRRNGRRQYRRY